MSNRLDMGMKLVEMMRMKSKQYVSSLVALKCKVFEDWQPKCNVFEDRQPKWTVIVQVLQRFPPILKKCSDTSNANTYQKIILLDMELRYANI